MTTLPAIHSKVARPRMITPAMSRWDAWISHVPTSGSRSSIDGGRCSDRMAHISPLLQRCGSPAAAGTFKGRERLGAILIFVPGRRFWVLVARNGNAPERVGSPNPILRSFLDCPLCDFRSTLARTPPQDTADSQLRFPEGVHVQSCLERRRYRGLVPDAAQFCGGMEVGLVSGAGGNSAGAHSGVAD